MPASTRDCVMRLRRSRRPSGVRISLPRFTCNFVFSNVYFDARCLSRRNSLGVLAALRDEAAADLEEKLGCARAGAQVQCDMRRSLETRNERGSAAANPQDVLGRRS